MRLSSSRRPDWLFTINNTARTPDLYSPTNELTKYITVFINTLKS
jgi:hypothetical protein